MKQPVLWIGFLVCACTVSAQTQIDLRTQGKRVDFADATSTRPVKTGTVLPATCASGEMFFLSTAPSGKNLYGCAGTNIWAAQAPSVAGGDVDGTLDSLTVTRIRGRNVSPVAPGNGYSLVWNAANGAWEPALLSTGGSGAVSSVAGKTGVVMLEAGDFIDCAVVRTSATVLAISSCKFSFPNRNKVTLPAITITATAGAGTAYIYVTKDAALYVGHSGTLSITCNNCTDAGPMNMFPEDAVRVATWPATMIAGQWDTTGVTDERVIVRGSTQIIPDGAISISMGPSGEKQISLNTAIAQTKSATQAGQELVCNGVGSAAAQTCTMIPSLTAYTPGMRIRFRPSADNTTGQTLNIDTLGALAIKRANGLTDPSASELTAGTYYDLTYDGTVLRLPVGVSAGAGLTTTPTGSGTQVSIDSAIVQTKAATQAGQEILCNGAGTAAAQTCTTIPNLTAYTPGMRIRFRPSADNTAGQTLNIDTLGALAIKRANGVTDLSAGELTAGNYYDLTYDGTVLRLPSGVSAGAGITATATGSGTQVSIDSAIVQTKAATQAGQEILCNGAGTAAAQTCTTIPNLTTYTPGMRIRFRPAIDNTAGQTLNIDTLGALAIKRANGVTDPSASELTAGNYYDLTYDGTVVRLPSGVSAGAGLTATATDSGTQVSIDSATVQTKAAAQAGQELLCQGAGSAATQTCTMNPALTAYASGMRIRFQPGTGNTGAQTLAANGLAAKAIKKSDGSTDPSSGELAANSYYDLTYDGTVFRLPPGTSGTGGGGSSPKTIEYIAAKCQNGYAASSFSFATTGFPTAACVTGANTIGGVLQFTDASTQSVQDRFVLPASVTSVSLDVWWRANATTGGSVWQLQTACVAAGEDEDGAWNAAQASISAAQGTANRWQKTTISSVTLTGCSAGEVFRFKLFRDPSHASDDLSNTAELISAVFTVQP